MSEVTSLVPVCCLICGKLVLEAEIPAGKSFNIFEIVRGKWLASYTVGSDGKTIRCQDCYDAEVGA